MDGYIYFGRAVLAVSCIIGGYQLLELLFAIITWQLVELGH